VSAKRLEVFDTSIQRSNEWLNDLMAELGISNKRAAYQTLRAVLHTLRDRLTPEEVSDLASGMPMVLRGMFYEGWSPGRQSRPERSQEAFLEEVAARYGGRLQSTPKEMAEAVFVVLSERISAGEVRDVRRLLPSGVRDLWPQERFLL
jgi:uncharacterized protein (DUF2267 family)